MTFKDILLKRYKETSTDKDSYDILSLSQEQRISFKQRITLDEENFGDLAVSSFKSKKFNMVFKPF